VNPVLGAVNVLLAYLFLRELYPRRTARLATLLLCASPWHLFMTMSLMSHTFSLCATLVAALAVARLRRTGRLRWGWLGGVAIGLVGLMRPLEGVAVAGLLGLWALVGEGRGWRRLRIVPAAVLAIGAALVGVANFPYNRALTGSPLRFPVMAYFDAYYGPGVNDLGFGPDRGVGWALDPFPGHGLLDVIVNADMNAFAINVELLGWATGSLLVLGALVLGARLRRADWLMLAAIAAIVGLHSLYWFSGGPDFGARYWYLVLLPCIALTARGLEWLSEGATPRVRPAAALLALGALLLFVPWRAADKYRHYREMRPDVRELAREHGFGRSLVLVQGKRFPDYASAIVYNPADVRDPDAPVYVWDRNQATREAVLRAYADRPVWVIEGSGVTGGAFRVAGGPWSARQALAALPPNDGRFDRTDGNAEGVVERAPARGSAP
jgi:4-amino-4-deoxy-L-arabinose transferase-like glycosyltransferase